MCSESEIKNPFRKAIEIVMAPVLTNYVGALHEGGCIDWESIKFGIPVSIGYLITKKS